MKIILSIIFIATLNASAVTAFSQHVDLKVNNTPLKDVFRDIQKQTDYDILYVSKDLEGTSPVSVNFVNKPLKEALAILLKGQPISFEMDKKTILITRNPKQQKIESRQESIPVTGRVTDSLGIALESVNITVKGKNIAVQSNADGYYTVDVPQAGDILEFRILGHSKQEYPVSSTTKVLNVRMKMQQVDIDDVVVIGYGAVSKKDLTGSVGQVKMSELTLAPVMSFDQALAGRLAGVQVSSNDGQPGSEGINIIVRGAGSLTQNTAPLYVVDDFPIEDFDASSLNMEDIQSISVLKDASATAIYGARGANGVVVIETKKGKAGQAEINYNGSVGFQETIKQVEMMSPYEFVRYQLERNDYSVHTQNIYTPGDLPPDNEFYDPNGRKLEDYRNIPGINWQDQVFRRGMTSIHELSLRGGKDGTRYSLSGSVFNQDGVVLNSGADRVTGRLSLDHNINKKLKTGVVANYSSNPSYGKLLSGSATHGYDYLMYSVWSYRPVSGKEGIGGIDEDLLNNDFDPESEENNYLINPIMTVENEDRRRKKTNLTANGYLEYSINKALNLRTTAAYMAYEDQTTGFYNSLTNRGTPRNPNNRGIQGDVAFAKINMWKSSTFLTYRKRFGKPDDLNVMVGTDFYESASQRYGFSNQYVPVQSLGLSGMDDGIPSSTTVTYSRSRLNSFFGRANYNFKSKYLFTTTFRADGSSKFSKANRWGYFPSMAFAWRISEERFMEGISSVITDAKIRTSYGHTGNNMVTDFAYLPTIIGSDIGQSYSFGNSDPTLGFYPGSPGNENLKWETTRQLDLGLDLMLFGDRISFVADIYRKNTTDLLLYANTPSHTGFKRAYKNIGALQNDGLELTLETTNIKTPTFTWSSNFNISFNRNKIKSLTNDESSMYSLITWDAIHNGSFLYAAQVGQQAAMFMGYLFDGVYQVDDFTWQNGNDPAIPHGSRNYVLKSHLPDNGGTSRDAVKPGDIKYKDINRDGTINQYDETIIGNPMPKHIGGFANNFTYKNIELNVFFQWSYGNDIYNANRIYFEGGRPVNSRNQYATYVDRWTIDNPTNAHFRAGGQGPLGRYSSKHIEDGSYLRLKTVSLSYGLPKEFLNRFNVKNLSLGVTAHNLFTWTNYSGMDPEVSIRHSTLTPGFDWSAYPRGRTVVFNIKANL